MKKSRQDFIQQSTLGLMGVFLSPAVFGGVDSANEGTVVHADEGETYWIGRRNSPLTIKIAKDKQGHASMCFCSEDIAPGEQIPIHKHLNEAELIFIFNGTGVLTLDTKEEKVKKGSAALVPKELWHGIKNTGTETLTMLFSYSPAGFEGYFREFGSPVGTP